MYKIFCAKIEIGHLAAAFDTMIRNIKSVTASRDELQSVKKRAEAATRATIV